MSLRTIFYHTQMYTSILLSALVMTGCTTLNTGLDSGELPPEGNFVAENGMRFHIKPLNLATLPAPTLTQDSHNNSNISIPSAYANAQTLISTSNRKDYQIAAGDVLSINLIGYPEITPANVASSNNASSTNPYASGYPVDQQGYIQFPLIGRIQASGLSVSQFTTKLRNQLQRYLKYPDPQVKIVNFRGNKFFIDGAVRNPGEFNIDDTPVSLYSAISNSGGATSEGDTNSVTLSRDGVTYDLGLQDLQQMGLSANQIYLQDGDSVHVNNLDRKKVYVLGEFGQIAPVLIPEQGLSLAHVLGQSRGLNSLTADATKVYIVRDHAQDQSAASYAEIYYVDLQTMTNIALANRFQMQPDDIVYVDPTGLTRWSRFINALLPSSTAIRQLTL